MQLHAVQAHVGTGPAPQVHQRLRVMPQRVREPPEAAVGARHVRIRPPELLAAAAMLDRAELQDGRARAREQRVHMAGAVHAQDRRRPGKHAHRVGETLVPVVHRDRVLWQRERKPAHQLVGIVQRSHSVPVDEQDLLGVRRDCRIGHSGGHDARTRGACVVGARPQPGGQPPMIVGDAREPLARRVVDRRALGQDDAVRVRLGPPRPILDRRLPRLSFEEADQVQDRALAEHERVRAVLRDGRLDPVVVAQHAVHEPVVVHAGHAVQAGQVQDALGRGAVAAFHARGQRGRREHVGELVGGELPVAVPVRHRVLGLAAVARGPRAAGMRARHAHLHVGWQLMVGPGRSRHRPWSD